MKNVQMTLAKVKVKEIEVKLEENAQDSNMTKLQITTCI